MNSLQENMSKLQKSIGYNFKNNKFLYLALFKTNNKNNTGSLDNEILEFIGDSVLSLSVISYLLEKESICKSIKTLNEQKKYIVSNLALRDFAVANKIHNYIIKPVSKNELPDNYNIKEIADTVESIIGAIFFDTGNNFQKTHQILLHWMKEHYKIGLKKSEQIINNKKDNNELNSDDFDKILINNNEINESKVSDYKIRNKASNLTINRERMIMIPSQIMLNKYEKTLDNIKKNYSIEKVVYSIPKVFSKKKIGKLMIKKGDSQMKNRTNDSSHNNNINDFNINKDKTSDNNDNIEIMSLKNLEDAYVYDILENHKVKKKINTSTDINSKKSDRSESNMRESINKILDNLNFVTIYNTYFKNYNISNILYNYNIFIEKGKKEYLDKNITNISLYKYLQSNSKSLASDFEKSEICELYNKFSYLMGIIVYSQNTQLNYLHTFTLYSKYFTNYIISVYFKFQFFLLSFFNCFYYNYVCSFIENHTENAIFNLKIIFIGFDIYWNKEELSNNNIGSGGLENNNFGESSFISKKIKELEILQRRVKLCAIRYSFNKYRNIKDIKDKSFKELIDIPITEDSYITNEKGDENNNSPAYSNLITPIYYNCYLLLLSLIRNNKDIVQKNLSINELFSYIKLLNKEIIDIINIKKTASIDTSTNSNTNINTDINISNKESDINLFISIKFDISLDILLIIISSYELVISAFFNKILQENLKNTIIVIEELKQKIDDFIIQLDNLISILNENKMNIVIKAFHFKLVQIISELLRLLEFSASNVKDNDIEKEGREEVLVDFIINVIKVLYKYNNIKSVNDEINDIINKSKLFSSLKNQIIINNILLMITRKVSKGLK